MKTIFIPTIGADMKLLVYGNRLWGVTIHSFLQRKILRCDV
jgi:hypothetical protein